MRGKRCLFFARALGVLCAVSTPLFYAGCDSSGKKIVTIWTDQSVVALYAGYFNAAQDTYKAEVFYFDNVSERLAEMKPEEKDGPDIVIGNWLNSSGTIALFRPVMSFYQGSTPLETVFYPGLLEDGRVKDNQVLLPVSFDVQVLVFDRNNAALLPDPFSLSLTGLQEAGTAYNLMQNDVWTRVGFSPLWNEEFLFLSTVLLGADWREANPAAANPVAWDDAKLKAALAMLREWVIIANGSVQADDDFSFKYSYESPDKLAAGGRILFSVMQVSDFFKLAEERRAALDFRWLEHEDRIVPTANVVYYGVCRNMGSRGAAAAFTNWFFSEEAQNEILAKGRAAQNAETFFGITDGFSAMRGVTETIFTRYYTGMLGHAPPGEKIVSPGVFPPFFPELKERVIIPAIREYIRSNNNGTNTGTLESRLSDWTRIE
ncbi:MAG: hypothetical protein LBG27_08480 [Spirochaetaceae bacterium]|nr:hypothetical protein [Spirochaetaceae bacterium]